MAGRLLTVPEAARYLGRSRDFVLRLIAEGKVPAETVGRRRYLARVELDALGRRPPEDRTPGRPAPVAVMPRRVRRLERAR